MEENLESHCVQSHHGWIHSEKMRAVFRVVGSEVHVFSQYKCLWYMKKGYAYVGQAKMVNCHLSYLQIK